MLIYMYNFFLSLSLLYLQYTYVFLYDILLKYKKDQSDSVKKSKVRVWRGAARMILLRERAIERPT